MIGVNIGVAAPVAFFPFSGWKDSFLGDLHAHGPDAVEFYTRKKTVTSRWFSSGQAQRRVLRRAIGAFASLDIPRSQVKGSQTAQKMLRRRVTRR